SCVPERGFQVPSALFFKTEASNGAVAKQFSFSYSPDLRISGFFVRSSEASRLLTFPQSVAIGAHIAGKAVLRELSCSQQRV
ncbi:MAG: hypothetical protein ABSF85_16975, partial [Terriglobales bacterium]